MVLNDPPSLMCVSVQSHLSILSQMYSSLVSYFLMYAMHLLLSWRMACQLTCYNLLQTSLLVCYSFWYLCEIKQLMSETPLNCFLQDFYKLNICSSQYAIPLSEQSTQVWRLYFLFRVSALVQWMRFDHLSTYIYKGLAEWGGEKSGHCEALCSCKTFLLSKLYAFLISLS